MVTKIFTGESKVYGFKDFSSVLHITITNTSKDSKANVADRGWLIVRDPDNDTVAIDFITELPQQFNEDRNYLIFVKDNYRKEILNKKVKLSLKGCCDDLVQKHNLVPEKPKDEPMAFDHAPKYGVHLSVVKAVLNILLLLSRF
jgi:hypothetical protein